MSRHPFVCAYVIFAVCLVGCNKNKLKTGSPAPVAETSIDLKAMDRGVDPCNDFYQYACGTWIKETKLPAGYSNWTRSFSGIVEGDLKTLKGILDRYAAGDYTPKTPFAAKVGDFYAACMDEASAITATETELPRELAKIDNTDKFTLPSVLARLHDKGVPSLFDFGVDQDYANATHNIGIIDRAGTGLPDKDYYLSPDPKMISLRNSYVEHIDRMLQLSGMDPTQTGNAANQILAFETELAKISLSLTERRDPASVYHPIGEAGLVGLAPNFDWHQHFLFLGVVVKELNVTELKYFQGLNSLLQSTDFGVIRNYLRWQFLHASASRLSEALFNENFAFYGKVLNGNSTPLPRWKECINAVNGHMGEALGQAFVALQFSDQSKKKTQQLVDNIKAAVMANFAEVGWMDETTRQQAKNKLTAIFKKIGFPDSWKDYGALDVTRNSYFRNGLNSAEFSQKRILARLGKPVDRTEWLMNPQEVNAYYNPNLNEIVFPAAILQSPFYKLTAAPASNYGGIGMVIGHEITHAFDDQGRHFDLEGNLKDWWTANSAKAFEERTSCLVNQYSGYTVSGDVHLNGKLTLGENIADSRGTEALLSRVSEHQDSCEKGNAPESAT